MIDVDMSVPVARSVFNLLNGVWSLNRSIIGYGYMKGVAKFEKYNNNNNTTNSTSEDLLYKEDGLFEFDNGSKFETHKEYIYSLDNNQSLGVYFVEHHKKDKLFHMLNFQEFNDTSNNKCYLIATALHLCSADTYDVKYEIYNKNEFKIIYTVKGPSKDYVSQTYFKRKEF